MKVEGVLVFLGILGKTGFFLPCKMVTIFSVTFQGKVCCVCPVLLEKVGNSSTGIFTGLLQVS